MRAATSVRDVLCDPIGAYYACQSFVVWFQPSLAGACVFERLAECDEDSLRELLLSSVMPAGYDLLCDCGAVEVFDERSYRLLASVLDSGGLELIATIRRIALVRPRSLAGVGLAGVFYEAVNPIADAALFADRAEALAWLGHASDSRVRAEIDEQIATMRSVRPVLRQMRARLMSRVKGASLASIAAALGMSERSLQRELTASGTSFRAELTRARIRTAESMLVGSDCKVETIARELGFQSAPAFTSLFGRVVGETPDAFRRRRTQRGRSE